MIYTNTDTRLRLTEIVSERVHSHLDLDTVNSPTMLANILVKEFSVSSELAEGVMWGEVIESVNKEDIEKLSNGLELHFDLLQLLLKPSSREINEHVLEKVANNDLTLHECDKCQQLDYLILDSELSNYSDIELSFLTLDMLDHLICFPVETPVGNSDRPESDWLEENDFPDEELEDFEWFDDNSAGANSGVQENSGSELSAALVVAFEKLSHSDQVDLLALAYKKLQTSQSQKNELERLQVFSLFRNRYLSSLATSVFDQLVYGPKIGLSVSDLIEKLDLSNRRSIGQLERSVNNAIDRLNEDYPEAELVNPLKVIFKGKEKHYLLDSDFLDDWKSVIRASEINKKSINSIVS